MRAYNVNSSNSKTIYAPLSFTTARHTTQESALLDTGAMHNFLDLRTVIWLGIGTWKLKQPHTVLNVNRTKNKAGLISKYAIITVSLGNKKGSLPFYVTNLGKDWIILGMTWFKALNLEINWEKEELSRPLSLQTKNAMTQINRTTTAIDWAIKAQKNDKAELPEHYQNYREVFCKSATQHFPPEREEDHEIKFINNVPSSFKAHTYHMDQEQIAFMRKWINKELGKFFIWDSKSPWPSPTFLIKKKNGDYRVIQDYQKLKSFTILDKTPLPLIPDLINQLHGKTLFTKFDIRIGYNNIQIKEGDQQKAAFTIPLGQYEPMVMSFGLRNAPETFMRTMNRLFRTMQNRYCTLEKSKSTWMIS